MKFSLRQAARTGTTVGYGDIYPVTTSGRALTMFLVLGRIGSINAITAVIAAQLVRKTDGQK